MLRILFMLVRDSELPHGWVNLVRIVGWKESEEQASCSF